MAAKRTDPAPGTPGARSEPRAQGPGSAAAQLALSRRSLLRGAFLGLGALGLPGWSAGRALAQLAAPGSAELIVPPGPLSALDFGPLVAQPVLDNLPDVDHQLFAPEGFAVRVVMRAGVNPLTRSTEGTLGHVAPDGGAVFAAPDGGWAYVSNSETGSGSVSAIRFAADGAIADYYRICTGTRRNCAGGRTPWGTWITCEEVPGGFAFECEPFGSPATQRRLDALGARDGREAVAIDPLRHVCYQTLDTPGGKLVRFISAPADLHPTPGGVQRMRLERGISERLFIPPFGEFPGFDDDAVPDSERGSAPLRQARPILWVPDTGSSGTRFRGAEGIGYYEMPEPLRSIPSAGRVPTRGLIFFSTKGDGRVWAIDIENDLIELIYDQQNQQAFEDLRNPGRPRDFDQVDNLVASPAGDVLVAEDGAALRIGVLRNGAPAKALLQITRGGSELAGIAFTPDGSRMYFASQRGPSGPRGRGNDGLIYELGIPPRFRALPRG